MMATPSVSKNLNTIREHWHSALNYNARVRTVSLDKREVLQSVRES
jgi:hypothetical protein